MRSAGVLALALGACAGEERGTQPVCRLDFSGEIDADTGDADVDCAFERVARLAAVIAEIEARIGCDEIAVVLGEPPQEVVCMAAVLAVEGRLCEGGSALALEYPAPSCVFFAAPVDCAPGEALEPSCREPWVEITTTDAALRATLEANLPPTIAALAEAQLLAESLESITDSLGGEAASAEGEACRDAAFHSLVDSGARITRVIEGAVALLGALFDPCA